MAQQHEPLSPEFFSDDIEPIYEDDIQSIISQVKPEDVQHFNNKQFVRITDEQMPEILHFIDESNQFDDWAIIGETQEDEESSVPGSSAADEKTKEMVTSAAASKNLFSDVDDLERSQEASPDEEEVEEEEEGEVPVNENENSMVFSMFLSNWEDQVRQIREAKRLEWEKKMKELLCNEENNQVEEPNKKEFIDEDGDSWVLVEGNDTTMPSTKASCTEVASSNLQVAVISNDAQVARRTGFFDNWPSFNVGSKLGVVLAATGTSFCFGFMMGARAAMDSFYRLCERPLVAGVVGVTTAFAVSIQPTVMITAVKYIILGGVVGGTAVATPVFVVGTTGVFVSAAVYHAFIAAKRGVVRAVRSPAPRSPQPIPKAVTIPLKKIAHDNEAAVEAFDKEKNL